MSNFYTLLTNIGAALHANAQVQQTTVAWSHFALGDGNGAAVVPTQTQTGLRREVHRLAITSIEAHPDNPNWIIVEAVVPSDVGGWTVRESAIYGGPGGNTCIAVGNYPETYKPVLAEGAGREMVMRMIVEISSVATVKLLIDPAVAIASRQWVQSLVASPQKAGLVKLATVPQAIEGVSQDTAVTPEGLKAAIEGLNGLPIFFNGHHDGDRASLIRVFNGMATPDDGDQLNALTHPDIVLGVLHGDVKSCTDAEWLADPYKRGMWSKGNAYIDAQGKPQGWVRMSDRNGVKEGSLPPPFWRGSGQGDAAIGTIAKDAMRNVTGRITNLSRGDSGHIDALAVVAGALKLTPSGVSKSTIQNSTSSYPTAFLDFDASLGLPPGHTTDPVTGEFRPWSLYGLSYTITANGIVNEAALDAAGVMAQVLLLQGRVTALEGWDLGVSTQKWVTTTTTRLQGVPYVADQTFRLRVEVNVGAVTGGSALVAYTIDGEIFYGATQPYGASALFVSEMLIPKGCTFSYQPSGNFNASTLKVREFRRGA